MRRPAEIRAELAIVNQTIARILAGGVSQFQQGGSQGGDGATMLSLDQLRAHRAELEQELARALRGPKARFVRAWRY